jgi:HAD superfamily hydrolase (TIGR01509 family)
MTTPFEHPDEVAAFLRARDSNLGADLEQAVDEVWTAQRHEARPIAGAAEAVRALADSGLRIAVISNIWAPYLDAVRAHFGDFLDDRVDAALQLFSFRQGCAKPAPALFLRALEVAGVEPAAAAMIGDSYAEDIEPAALLGLRTVWLLHRPEREAADLERVSNGAAPTPSRTLNSIAELTPDLVAAALAGPTEATHVG